jgi:type III secretion system low calcium response chaperone LcrH/SycD
MKNINEKAVFHMWSLAEILEKTGLSVPSDDFPEEHFKALYSLAYDLYQRAQYIDAKVLFFYLLLNTKFDVKNLLGLAACFHAEKDYGIALTMYQQCTQCGINYPMIHFYLCECLLYLGNKTQAVKELQAILRLTNGSTDLAKLQTKADAMIRFLDQGGQNNRAQ